MARNSLRGFYVLTDSKELAFKIIAKAYGSIYLCRSYWVLEPDTWWQRNYELVDISRYKEHGFYKSIIKCKKIATRGGK